MGIFAEGGAVMPGLGLLYIAAVLRANGFLVVILDAEGRRLGFKETVENILEEDPDIIGISTTTLNIGSAARVAKGIKARAPETKIVLGGPHVTAMPVDTMERYPAVDGCVLGDGERSFSRLVRNIQEREPVDSGLDGLVWRENGRLMMVDKKGHFEDLDSLPFPAWDLLKGFPEIYRPPFHSYRRLPVANIITTRGCPYACSFCDRSVFGRKVLSHSVEYVVEMIAYLVREFGIREISIKDDMFTRFPERVMAFCRQLKKKGLALGWSCNARVDGISEEMLKEMKKAGCWMISYGIESGSPSMLKRMKKGITLSQVRHTLEITRMSGIVTKGFFMLGIPGETRQTLQETLSFIQEIPLDEMNVNFFTPFPGAAMTEEAISDGFTPVFEHMNMVDAVFIPHGLTAGELKQYQRKIIRRFYCSPRKVASLLFRAVRGVDELKRIVRMGKMLVQLVLEKIFHPERKP